MMLSFYAASIVFVIIASLIDLRIEGGPLDWAKVEWARSDRSKSN